jgi:phosphoribosylformimino-5-aminoimidazole carboxamide ribotide isomerase
MMTRMNVIPAIDLINGKCVRLLQGDYGKVTVYNENPLTIAKQFEDEGFEYLHLVDLDGARQGNVVNWKVVEKIAEHTALKVDFGGGVQTEEEIDRLLGLGIHYINIGSLAVRKPNIFSEWLHKFGPDNFILSADVKSEVVQISGWKENTPLTVYELIKSFMKDNLLHVACTDIQSDGMLNGPNLTLYKKLKARFPDLRLIASGGVSSIDDVQRLRFLKLNGVIIGKALYEKKITASELKQANLI